MQDKDKILLITKKPLSTRVVFLFSKERFMQNT
jgi:hypothetical protein